jgi:hypothetical protein
MLIKQLVRPDHRYRKFAEMLDFEAIYEILKRLVSDNQCKGFGILRPFKCLYLTTLASPTSHFSCNISQANATKKIARCSYAKRSANISFSADYC